VPSPKAGGLRISYINMHQASQFQDRMNRVMKSGTAWLKANPRLQIWEEWSGLWDDSGVSQSVHEGNLQYLKNRQAKEGEQTNGTAVVDCTRFGVATYSDATVYVYKWCLLTYISAV
jgi:hypothetical protein